MHLPKRHIILGLLVFGGCAIARSQPPQDQKADQASLQPQVAMETTMGEIVLELDAEKAPLTVMNFLEYAQRGFYKGTVFHRVVKGKMIHGGGYTLDLSLKNQGLRDPVHYEGGNGLIHNRGSVGAYRRFDNLDSAQSQFFINTANNDFLDKLRDGSSYVVFGRVVRGMDVVEKIESVPVGKNSAIAAGLNPFVPITPVVIQSMRIMSPLDRAKAEAIAKVNADAAADPVGFRTKQLQNECKSPVIETGSGLRFIECEAGNGSFPLETDTVEINYRGTLANGAEFDNSKNRGNGPMAVKVENMIRGLREGLQKMRESARYVFIVPPELGYGNEGVPGKVPPGATLFFDVELVIVRQSGP